MLSSVISRTTFRRMALREIKVYSSSAGRLVIGESFGRELEYEFGMASCFELYLFVAAVDLLIRIYVSCCRLCDIGL
jgi:hypothetical protein